MIEPTQMRGTTAAQDARPATQKAPMDRLNDKAGLYSNVAIGSRRELRAIRRKMLAGDVSVEDKDNMLYSLAEVIHDLQAVAEYCEQAEAEIRGGGLGS